MLHKKHRLRYNFFFLNKKTIYQLYLYSINGREVCREQLAYQLHDMIVKEDYCILAALVNQHQSQQERKNSPNDSGFLTASKIIFKENFELKTIQTMRLKAPVTTIFLTKEDSHLLVGLNDGKLIVITGEKSFK